MVQLKYFGDSRDFFKYDLISTLLVRISFDHYVFVPMLTQHRIDNEGGKISKLIDGKSAALLGFITACEWKSLKHWERWLSHHIGSYLTVEPVDEFYFSDETRAQYWEAFRSLLTHKKSLVFVDPDTGLETGKPGYLKSMGREKYILNYEAEFLVATIDQASVLMLYQHLPYDKRMHTGAVALKMEQLQRASDSLFVCAYREDDLAFLFAAKDKSVYQQIRMVLRSYHEASHHKFKSLHCE